MKKILSILFVLMILVGCSPMPQQAAGYFVSLPEPQRIAITTLFVAAVGWLFAYIGSFAPWSVPFLEKYKMEISLALSAAFIGWLENLLPSAYPEISILVVELVLALIAAYGVIQFLVKRAGAKFASLKP